MNKKRPPIVLKFRIPPTIAIEPPVNPFYADRHAQSDRLREKVRLSFERVDGVVETGK